MQKHQLFSPPPQSNKTYEKLFKEILED